MSGEYLDVQDDSEPGDGILRTSRKNRLCWGGDKCPTGTRISKGQRYVAVDFRGGMWWQYYCLLCAEKRGFVAPPARSE